MTSLRAAALIAVVGMSSLGLSGCGKESSASAQGVAKTPTSAAATASSAARTSTDATASATETGTMTRQQLLDRPIPAKPKKPVLPAAAKVNTTQGAAAFVKYYFESLDYGTRSGDSATILSASDPSCGFCKRRVNQVQKLKNLEHKFVDQMDMITIHRSLRINSHVVLVHSYHQVFLNTRHRVAKGSIQMDTSPKYTAEVALIWERGKWQVADVRNHWETAEAVRRGMR